MKVARGKYFFLLNSDTLLVNNAIKEFYDYAESYEPRTLYGCYLIGDDGTYRRSFYYFPALTIGAFSEYSFVNKIIRQTIRIKKWNVFAELICLFLVLR